MHLNGKESSQNPKQNPYPTMQQSKLLLLPEKLARPWTVVAQAHACACIVAHAQSMSACIWRVARLCTQNTMPWVVRAMPLVSQSTWLDGWHAEAHTLSSLLAERIFRSDKDLDVSTSCKAYVHKPISWLGCVHGQRLYWLSQWLNHMPN